MSPVPHHSAASQRCPQCGSTLSTSISGLCPVCLMRMATLEPAYPVESWTDVGADDATQRIGNYEIIEELARGGMGIVYRARQSGAGRVVALKSLLPQLLNVSGMLSRFRQEIAAAARLDHPAVLPIYEVGEHAGVPYFSMKLAEGGNLRDRQVQLRDHWHDIAALMIKLARGVEHAHARGIVHRDIKPENILFDAHGEPMLGDFGLARIRSPERTLTVLAGVIGSPQYMAPEQVSAEYGEITVATDVYALGAVLYELLTGHVPIVGEDVSATMRLVPTQPPVPGVRLNPSIPADLDAIALKCLSKQSAERYPSAEAVAQDLERWCGGLDVVAQREHRHRRISRLARRIAIFMIAVAVPAAAWIFWPHPGEAIRPATAPIKSIAVLPFRNLGAQGEDDYISSGVTDDMLQDLHQIESLNVVPFRFGNSVAQPFSSQHLADRYDVDLVLEGDFERRDGKLQVNARLWDTRNGRDVWSHHFDAAGNDVRLLRTTIADALITQLQIEVGADTRARFGRDALTRSPAAYVAYLKARYLIRWRRHDTLAEAAQLLRRAIALDPDFARAYSALAYNYVLWIEEPPPEGPKYKLAVEFARKALQLDPNLGEAYAVLGNLYGTEGNFTDAELNLRRAVESDPRDPSTLHLYCIHLFSVGKLREALEIERRSVAIDGTSPQPMMWLAILTTMLGERGEAERLWARADDLGAARPLAAALSRLDIGQTQPLLEWYRSAGEDYGIKTPGNWPELLSAAVADPSRPGAALAMLRSQEANMYKPSAILHYGLLGATDDVFRLTRKFRLQEDTELHLQIANIWSPRLTALRQDPRFADLLQRWGLVDYWRRFGAGDLCELMNAGVRCK